MADITLLYPQLKELDEHLLAIGDLGEKNRAAALASLSHPELMSIACIGIPAEFNPYRSSIWSDISYEHHLQVIEYLCRSDASAMMMLPGASLSTRAILTLGTHEQQARFFSCFSERPAWTFFAVSEPEKGSDATDVHCELSMQQDSGYINGTKMFIGGALNASVGIVFARYQQSHRLVMIFPDNERHGPQRELLATFGLQGAGLTRLVFDDYPVLRDDILGHQHRGLQQGLNALSLVFERHRPMVAAIALGTTFGLLTRLENYALPKKALRWKTQQWRKYHALYKNMLSVAEGYSLGKRQYAQTSQLKLGATRLVEETAHAVPLWLRRDDWLSDSTLRRKYRDSFAFEYMEGTTNIHLLNSLRPPQPV
ncbi:acyl-CoA dehydrogenase family protein [Dickeya poaceiphila]|uniref:Acyl-CoA dehydrogenase n=1 Tax=Dickeya poaceiphila TaxID=568768 RepID=A0A5B8HT84_9GAMM|nr:acyl-CoA dehydrogenase family protein [Dickeya poaceiphila]QDX31506.1 acyl-CoA dehydrogenase [Dickeya poaceiphila]